MTVFQRLFIGAVLLLAFSSCKNLKSITARDSSTRKSSGISAKKTARKNVKFIDGIEVSPGHTTKATRHNSRIGAAKPLNIEGKGQKTPEGFNIENADWLQFKYAIITDVTIEKLLNVELLKVIDYWYGTRYCIGGSTTNCVDCSAFTQNVLRDAYSLDVPRTAQQQYDACEPIDLSNMKEGDLVFFNTVGRSVSHVGIYLLNNKFVHASTSGGVMVSDLNEAYWKKRFIRAGRARAGATAGN